jgi:hypothetical protein
MARNCRIAAPTNPRQARSRQDVAAAWFPQAPPGPPPVYPAPSSCRPHPISRPAFHGSQIEALLHAAGGREELAAAHKWRWGGTKDELLVTCPSAAAIVFQQPTPSSFCYCGCRWGISSPLSCIFAKKNLSFSCWLECLGSRVKHTYVCVKISSLIKSCCVHRQ